MPRGAVARVPIQQEMPPALSARRQPVQVRPARAMARPQIEGSEPALPAWTIPVLTTFLLGIMLGYVLSSLTVLLVSVRLGGAP